MKKALPLLIAGSLIFLSSCRKDGGPSWDTGIVVPVAHASMTINNLIPDSLINTNPDGSIKLVYSTDFPGLSTDTLFQIPDTTVVNSYHLPFGSAPFNPGDVFPTGGPQQTTYNVNTAQIVFGLLSQGKMVIKLQNDLRKRVILRYQIPGAAKNSIPFDTSFTIPAAADSLHGYFENKIIDLSGYSIDFTGTNHNRVNTLETIFTAQIDPTETGTTTAYPSDTVGANCTFTGIKPFYIQGYFGTQTIAVGPTESPFSFFRNIRSGSLGLDSLKMSLDIANYIGMDARMTVNRIWSRNAHTNTSVNLTQSGFFGVPINVNRAQYGATWPDVNPSVYHFEFDNGNSNAKMLLENLPNYFGYDATLLTNPLGYQNSNDDDFLYAAHGIQATLNVEMPLNFFASQLVIADTVVPNFSSVKNRDHVLDATLTLNAQNSFPFAGDIQIYLLDAYNNVLDSIVTQPNRITAGQISWNNGYFISIGANNSTLKIPLSTTKTVTLFNSSKIIIKTIFDTNSSPVYTKIFSTNQLDLQISADFDYRVN